MLVGRMAGPHAGAGLHGGGGSVAEEGEGPEEVPDVIWLHGVAYRQRKDQPKEAGQGSKDSVPKSLLELLGREGLSWADVKAYLDEQMALGDEAKATELALGLVKDQEEPFRHALMTAVDLGNVALVKELLSVFARRGWVVDQGCASSVSFGPQLSPFLLAAIRNDFTLVRLFLEQGLRLEAAHLPDCVCEDCREGDEAWEKGSLRRVTVLRALASPAYLLQANHDPFLFAMELAGDLQKSLSREPSNKDAYSAILAQLQKVVGDLAGEVRTREEALVLLRRSEGIQLPSGEFPLPRLRLALDSGFKSFVASPGIQNCVRQQWLGGWADEGTVGAWEWAKRYALHTLLYPFTSVAFLVTGGTWPRSYDFPKARYVSFVTSYVVFLLALVGFALRRPNAAKRGLPEGAVDTALLAYIFIYVFGLMWRGGMALVRYGPKRFFAVWQRILDLAMWVAFVMAFNGWCHAVWEPGRGPDELSREHWIKDRGDAQLRFEVFFSMALVFALWRAAAFVQMTRTLGPTIISVGRCVKDISLYLVIILGFMLSFALGMFYLYSPYKEGKEDPRGFYELEPALTNLYWAFFGYLPPEDFKLTYKSGEEGGYIGTVGMGIPVEHRMTFHAGRALVVCYHVFLVIIMINLMVALLVNSAGEVMVAADVEWKWMRANIWGSFMEEDAALPPPFGFFHWLLCLGQWAWSPRRRFQLSPPNLCYLQPTAERHGPYASLLLSLFLRYAQRQHTTFVPAALLRPDNVQGPSPVFRLLQSLVLSKASKTL